MSSRKKLTLSIRIFVIGVGLTALYWVFESAMYTLISRNDNLIRQVFTPGAHTFWMRLVAVCVILIFTIYSQISVSRRKQTLLALQESEVRYRDLFENAGDLIQSITPDGRFIYTNHAWQKALGYSMAELDELSLTDIIHPESLEHCMQVFHRVMSGEDVGKVEAIFVARDGREIVVEGKVNCRVVGGKPVATRGIFRDITERKQAEQALMDERAMLAHRVEERTAELRVINTELAKANHLKDEFLANMSHELRTPLSVILGMSEAMKKSVHGTLNEKQSQFLQRIEEGGRNLLSLINSILNIARIDAGKLEMNIRTVSVKLVCQTSLELISQQAHKKHLDVSLKLDSMAPMIQADEGHLREILLSLLDNAVKFTPEGGAMGLEIVPDSVLTIAGIVIWDHGMGVSE